MKPQAWAILFAVSLCSSEDITAILGEDVTFNVGESGIKTILWKFGNDKVADYDPQFESDVIYYGRFKERSGLDLKSGNLKISELTAEDAGKFSVEINNVLSPKTFTLTLYPKVTAVEIKRENPDVQPCKLFCTATLSAKGKSAEFKWSAGEDVIENTQLLTVQEDKRFKSYTCTASNPVSLSNKTVSSDSLCGDPTPVWIPVTATFGSFGAIAVVALAVAALYKSGRLPIGKTNSNRASNGSANPVNQPLKEVP